MTQINGNEKVVLSSGGIQISAVEVKDASTGDKLKVNADGTIEVLSKIKDSAGNVISPAKEDGNLAKLDVALSTIASEATLSAIKSALSSIGTDKLLTTPDNPSNLDVALSTIRDLFSPVSGSDSVTAANNTSGLSVSLNAGGRPTVEVYYNVSDAATINIYGSTDGSTWRYTSSITIPAAEEKAVVFSNGYMHVKAECITTGIDVTLEISASR